MLGLVVLVLLAALLVLVALHPATDVAELAATCLALVGLVILSTLVTRPVGRVVVAAPVGISRPRPPTRLLGYLARPNLTPLRL